MNTWNAQKRLFKAPRVNGQHRVMWQASLPTLAALYGQEREQRLLVSLYRRYTTELEKTPDLPPCYGFQAWGRTLIALEASEGRPATPAAVPFMVSYLEQLIPTDSVDEQLLMELWQSFYPADFVEDSDGSYDFRPGAFSVELELAA
jgi:hypothetical protein